MKISALTLTTFQHIIPFTACLLEQELGLFTVLYGPLGLQHSAGESCCRLFTDLSCMPLIIIIKTKLA